MFSTEDFFVLIFVIGEYRSLALPVTEIFNRSLQTADSAECITFCNKTETLPFTAESTLAEITDHMKTIK